MSTRAFKKAEALADYTFLAMTKVFGDYTVQCSGCDHEVPKDGFFIKGRGLALCVDCCLTVNEVFERCSVEQIAASRPMWHSIPAQFEEYPLPLSIHVTKKSGLVNLKLHEYGLFHLTTREYFDWLVAKKNYVKWAAESNNKRDTYKQQREASL